MKYYYFDGSSWRAVSYSPPQLLVPVSATHEATLRDAGVQMCLAIWSDGLFIMVTELTAIQYGLKKLTDPYGNRIRRVLYERKS